MKSVDAGQEALMALIEPLATERSQLQLRLDEIAKELAPLEEALAMLKGKKKAHSKARRKPEKPTVRKKDVLTVCKTLVEENRGIARGDLKALAKQKLATDLQLDLKGYELRFKETLSSPTFDVATDGTVRLASDPCDHAVAAAAETTKLAVDSSAVDAQFD